MLTVLTVLNHYSVGIVNISKHCNAFICCGDNNTSFKRNNAQTECLNNFIEKYNLVVSWNHPVSKKKYSYTNFPLYMYRSDYYNT